MQIINQGNLVYSSSIDELLNKQTTRYEISLSATPALDEISGQDIFTSVERVDEHNFIIDSDSSAE